MSSFRNALSFIKQILFEYKNENLIKGLDGLNNTPLHISGER